MSSNAIFARNPEAAVSQSAPCSIQALPLSHPPSNPIFSRDFPCTLLLFFTNLDIAGNERKL